ncbi:hypothetical protein JCM19992_21290 [Thermostilla marina]
MAAEIRRASVSKLEMTPLSPGVSTPCREAVTLVYVSGTGVPRASAEAGRTFAGRSPKQRSHASHEAPAVVDGLLRRPIASLATACRPLEPG